MAEIEVKSCSFEAYQPIRQKKIIYEKLSTDVYYSI